MTKVIKKQEEARISDGVRSVITEMSHDNTVEGLVKLDSQMVENIVGDDKDPMFVTLEVLNEGVSNNGRYYDADALQSVCEQINAHRPDGYAGHITEAERKHKVPDAEVFWLGARVIESDGKLRLFAKGYVLPDATKRRSYLKRAKAAGKNVAVSIYGTAKQVFDSTRKAYRQTAIELESIDFTRPFSEGVPNSGMMAITAEMRDDSKVNNEERDAMEKAEVLKAASADDLKEFVPKEVIAEMAAELVEEATREDRAIISEMKETLGDNPVEVIAEMQAENRSLKLKSQLADKVVDSKARKMIERMVISEMSAKTDASVTELVDGVLASEEGRAIVSEMTTVEPVVQPRVEQEAATAQRRSWTIKRK